MSVPTEIEFARIKIGDGATPTEVFTTICGLENVTVNETVSTTDRGVRDCTTPNAVPNRRVKVTLRQTDITGSGLSNADEIADLRAALGKTKNYRIECYADDGTDAGDLLGTYAGPFVMTASNLNLTQEGAASAEITLASDGAVTYTAAP